MRGDVAREWISDVYDAIDYERVMAEADALAADAGISNDDEDAELMYGEFDAGFFVALAESLEPELRALEEGDVDGGAVVNGSFVDIGSGRGQIAVLASVLRTWQRCVGLEVPPRPPRHRRSGGAHPPRRRRPRRRSRRVPAQRAETIPVDVHSRRHVRRHRPRGGARGRDARLPLLHGSPRRGF